MLALGAAGFRRHCRSLDLVPGCQARPHTGMLSCYLPGCCKTNVPKIMTCIVCEQECRILPCLHNVAVSKKRKSGNVVYLNGVCNIIGYVSCSLMSVVIRFWRQKLMDWESKSGPVKADWFSVSVYVNQVLFIRLLPLSFSQQLGSDGAVTRHIPICYFSPFFLFLVPFSTSSSNHQERLEGEVRKISEDGEIKKT